jgi:hypothetical protein
MSRRLSRLNLQRFHSGIAHMNEPQKATTASPALLTVRNAPVIVSGAAEDDAALFPTASAERGIPMLHHLINPVLLLGLLLIGNPAHAQGSTTRQGMLTCRTPPSLGLIVGSTQRLACQFKGNSGLTQDYVGRMNRVGLDIGFTAGGVMAWAVLGNSSAIRPGALTGRFVGASGDISVGVGAGANLLVGGTAQSISLQPLSLEGQVGLNLALGVAGLTLTPVR